MGKTQSPDPSWLTISRSRPTEQNFETLLALLRHSRWEVRWNAARELSFLGEAGGVDALVEVLQGDPNDSVRMMASQALGVLHEKGILVSLYQPTDDASEKAREKLALARLKELKVRVIVKEDAYELLIPHELLSPLYIEIGYLMAQLADVSFPMEYSPLSEVISLVIPHRHNPYIEFRESYPHGLKYVIYRQRS